MLAKSQMWWPGIDLQHPLTAGLAGCWAVSEGAGSSLNDVSGNGHTATLENMDPATDWVGSPEGSVLDFDGSDDELKIPTLTAADFTGGMTWVLRTKLSSNNTGAGTLLEGHAFDSWVVRVNAFGGALVMYDGSAYSLVQLGSTLYYDDAWHTFMVTVTRGGTGKLHVDGIEVDSAASINAWTLSTDPVVVFSRDTADWVEGQLSFLACWKRQLSDLEARQLHYDPYVFVRMPVRPWRYVPEVAAGFVPYPNPRYAMRGGMQPMAGGLV